MQTGGVHGRSAITVVFRRHVEATWLPCYAHVLSDDQQVAADLIDTNGF
jgi:hypothetical protein